MDDVTVIMLAGGEGKRFWPLSAHKALFSFLGTSVLAYNLSCLAKQGFLRVLIVSSPNAVAEIRKISIPGMRIDVVIQKEPTGMADGLLSAEKSIKTRSVLIMNATDVVDESLYTQVAGAMAKGKQFVVGKLVAQYFDGGYFKMNGNRVSGMVEKPGEGNEPSKLTNLVFHYYPDIQNFIREIKKTTSDKDDIYEKALSSVIEGGDVHIVRYEGSWVPLKYPWHLLDIMDHILRNKTKEYRGNNVGIKANVVIEGPVHIGDNVKIFENTKIVGPCYIGENTIIGNNNIIRHSHIDADCVTGFNTDITRSYVGDGCWFHSNYIGDSVLEKNVTMGSGAVLANLRLDDGEISSYVRGSRLNTKRMKLGAIIGEGVRIGINASIMPGIKIGRRSFIGAGVVLDKDVEDESFCVANTGYTATKNTRASASSKSRDAYKKYIG